MESLKGKRLAVFGANHVTEEVTAFARRHGIVLVSVGNVPEAPMPNSITWTAQTRL